MRYVLAFSVLALSLPLIGFVYENYGFDALFRLMAALAAAIFLVDRMPAVTAPDAGGGGA